MAKVLQILEVNFAVKDFDKALAKFRALGFEDSGVFKHDTPPVQAQTANLSVPGSTLALMSSFGANVTPIARFLEKRGEGIFSVTLLIDNLPELMEEWGKEGVEFVLPQPIEFRDQMHVGNEIPWLVGNWTRPGSLFGVVIELAEYRDKDGKPYYPPNGVGLKH